MQALGTVMGQVFINLFKPVISSINNSMNTILGLVEKAVNAIGKLLGWQMEIIPTAVEMSEDMQDVAFGLDDASEGADGTADGLSEANKKAKELKKTIMSFDQLHVLNSNKDSDSDSGSGSGSGSGSALDDFLDGGNGVTGGEMILKKYASDVVSWFDLGKRISDALSKAMEDIDWEGIYKKARNFGKGLAEFLNGLINPRLFSNVGRTIAGALNTALHFLDSFGETFDWKNLGNSIAAGINTFFGTFDFALMGHTLTVWAKGLLDAFLTALRKTDWKMIGTQIGTFLVNIDFIGIGSKIVQGIYEAINAAFLALKGLIDTAPLETSLLGLIAVIGLVTPHIGGLFKQIVNSAVNEKLAQISAGFGGFAGMLQTVTKYLGVAVAGFAEFFIIKNNIKEIADLSREGTGSILDFAKNIAQIGSIATGVGAILINVFGFPAGLIASAVIGLIGAFVGLKESIDGAISKEYEKNISELKASTEGAGHTIDDFAAAMTEASESITIDLNGITDSFKTLGTTRDDIQVASDSLNVLFDTIRISGSSTTSTIDEVISEFGDLGTSLQNYIEQYYDGIIKQMELDAQWLHSQGKITDEDYKQRLLRISHMREEKDTELQKVDEVMNAYDSEMQTLDDLRKTYGDNSEEVNRYLNEIINTHSDLNDIMEKYGFTQDENNDIVSQATEEFKKLKGSLDISAESAANADELNQRLTETIELMNDTSNQAIADIEENSRIYQDEINAMNISDAEREQLLNDNAIATQMRIDEIKTAYSQFAEQATGEMDEMASRFNDAELQAVRDAQDNMGTFQRAFSDALQTVRGWVENFKVNLPKLRVSGTQTIDAGGQLLTVPTFSYDAYANGGFPEDGFFLANHGELVGKFANGKTAVANNEQITEGIRAAVVDGMMEVFMATQSNSNASSGDVVLMIDSEEIARASMRGQRNIDRRFNPIVQFS